MKSRIAARLQLVTPGRDGFEPLELLRQRPFRRVFRLPFGRALVVGRRP